MAMYRTVYAAPAMPTLIVSPSTTSTTVASSTSPDGPNVSLGVGLGVGSGVGERCGFNRRVGRRRRRRVLTSVPSTAAALSGSLPPARLETAPMMNRAARAIEAAHFWWTLTEHVDEFAFYGCVPWARRVGTTADDWEGVNPSTLRWMPHVLDAEPVERSSG